MTGCLSSHFTLFYLGSRHSFPSGGSRPSPLDLSHNSPSIHVTFPSLPSNPLSTLASALGSRCSVRHFAVALRASNFPERGDFITSHFLSAGAFPRPRVHPFLHRSLRTWLFPPRRENAGCFVDAISFAARVGECRTLTCFRTSIREG